VSSIPTAPSTWTIDPAHSSVGFSVRHLMVSKVRGSFGSFAGTITIGADGAAKVEATVDVGSVSTGNEQRDGHLRTADFFLAEQYPQATFTSTAITGSGDDYTMTGDLTIRGVTRSVDFAVEFLGHDLGMGRGEVIGFEATTVLRRQDFGITIDIPLETGSKVVGDKVTLSINVEALKEA
jgi:polyisoprenoid-binding protein YceI